MPATVVIMSLHGATGATETQVDGGTMRFKAADNDTADAVNPLVIPGAGSIYSYIKQIRLKCTVTPANTVDNTKFYSDGANGLGTGVGAAGKTYAFGSYINPATQAQTQLAATTDIFTYTSGAPLAVTGTLSNPSTGFVGDVVALQMSVASTAGQGTTGSETITWAYDES